MHKYNYTIRREKPSDIGAIDQVTKSAFASAAYSSGTESFIIKALRANGQLAVSLVAEEEGVLIGHIAISPVTISSGSEGWFGLGPVSVIPSRQGAGVGSGLIRAAIDALKELHASGCVVLGEPSYYGRFGFRSDARLQYLHAPAEYFQIQSFAGKIPEGIVEYDDSFNVTS
ncbi:GNAT family N-acetyltransferase [Pseudobacter ginsenosidimutans]|uniref:Putative acetyltransferase n=1 Tax=Pseudobacter ginsenosidimutans TaxID=661488 RepID=A0A4Q7N3G4_9BACT|nr:N-acetyltransferase [Pseudobacter ginsenosidimutans]QEC43677.1 N-acetyltransferase [Pseudobacter ginsenosidimutans]RZS75078.1 putative acetyltransferase [Pseudobacter ginsenosidimutans]